MGCIRSFTLGGGKMVIYRSPGESGAGPADIVMDTILPDQGAYREIDGYDDVELKGEMDDIPEGVDPELAGKSREELLAEIGLRSRAAQEAQSKADPVGALNANFDRFLQSTQPKPVVVEGWKTVRPGVQAPVTPADQEAYKRKMADRFLDDPVSAQQELMREQLGPLLAQFAENQAMQSRELAMLSPETKDIFSRYAGEVEQEVSLVSVQEKLQNPRVYQMAVERVKTRHMTELIGEQSKAQVDILLAERLKELGIDPAVLKNAPGANRPAVGSLATPAGQRPPATGAKTTIRLTPATKSAVEQFAKARGVSLETAAAHLRERGQI